LDQATSTVSAAAIGAFAGIGSGLLLEAYKRRQERRGVAMALAGAIAMQLGAIERRGHLKFFKDELARLRAGEVRAYFGFADKDQVRDPIADAYIEKYGMLGGDLTERVIHFFQTMWGIRVDVSRLVSGHFADAAVRIHVIQQDIDIVEDLQVTGKKLAQDLRASAEWPFASILNVWRDMTRPPM
jgi:hypothetical protein